MGFVLCPSCGERNSEFNLRCALCGKPLSEAPAASEETAGIQARPEPPPASEQDDWVGRTLGPYQILDRLGRGGMGVVFRALDLRLRRPVALKMLASEAMRDPAARARLLREARAASALDHPHVGVLHAIEEHDGQLLIVQALYEGETLRKRIERGPLPIPEAEQILRQIASGLAAAHEAGIVHRDLKPANVMLTAAGQVKILDFGLAKRLGASQENSALTEPGKILGTIDYMSPEQARNEAMDHRTDLWSLGVVAYELLTGVRPFHAGHSVTTLFRIFNEEPRPLQEVRPDTPPRLVALVGGLLVKDPDLRIQSAAEVLQRLAASSAPASSSGRRGGVAWRRIALAAGAAALLAAPLGLWLSRPQPPAEPAVSGLPAASAEPRRSVAVLGFKSLSGRAEEAWFSTAFSEMLRTELAVGEALRIAPGENVARMKLELAVADTDSLAPDTLRQIRRNLGADLVVLGSYLALGAKAGGQIRIDLRIQETASGETLASVATTGTETEIFDLVSRAGAQLRHKLGIEQRTADQALQVQAALPAAPEIARLYGEGLAKLRIYDALSARELLEKAVALGPDYPLPHAALADVLSELGDDERARQEAERAFSLSAGLSREERLSVEARYREKAGEWEKAADLYGRLYAFFPDDLEYGLRLAAARFRAGRLAESLAGLEALRRLPAPISADPRIDIAEAMTARWSGDNLRARDAASRAAAQGRETGAKLLRAEALTWMGDALRTLGQTNEAGEAFEEARRRFAEAGHRRGVAFALWGRATVLWLQGKLDPATAAAQEALQICRDIGQTKDLGWVIKRLGNVLLDQGDLAGAEKAYEEALAVCQKTRSGCEAQTWCDLGELLGLQGHLEKARGKLEACLELSRNVGDQDTPGSALRHLAELSLEAGDSGTAAALASQAAEGLRAGGLKDREALAVAVQASALLAQGDVPGSRQAAERAVQLAADSEIPFVRLRVAVLAGRVRAASGKPADAAEALRSLETAAAEAAGAGLAGLRLEALLALGEIELGSGRTETGRGRLREVEQEARAKGYGLMASKAQTALASAQGH
jgi:tetratricopeptide (TPR) repeat protein